MDEVLEYLKECGVFFIAADKDGAPLAAPFREVCAFDGHICVMADRDTERYEWLKGASRIAIAAVHPDKSWIRITGDLAEDPREEARRAMDASFRETLTNVEVAEDSTMTVFCLTKAHAVVYEEIGKRQEWDLP